MEALIDFNTKLRNDHANLGAFPIFMDSSVRIIGVASLRAAVPIQYNSEISAYFAIALLNAIICEWERKNKGYNEHFSFKLW